MAAVARANGIGETGTEECCRKVLHATREEPRTDGASMMT